MIGDVSQLTPEEVGRKAAADLDVKMRQMQADRDFVLNYLNNTDAARRHVRASGGTESDAMRMIFDAGDKPIERPRPRLVVVDE